MQNSNFKKQETELKQEEEILFDKITKIREKYAEKTTLQATIEKYTLISSLIKQRKDGYENLIKEYKNLLPPS